MRLAPATEVRLRRPFLARLGSALQLRPLAGSLDPSAALPVRRRAAGHRGVAPFVALTRTHACPTRRPGNRPEPANGPVVSDARPALTPAWAGHEAGLFGQDPGLLPGLGRL